MGELFRKGDERIRPGVSYRYSDKTEESIPGARDGINAFVLNANWGETGKVVAVTSAKEAEERFGDNASVKALQAVFEGGAKTVYAYRPAGKDGVAGSFSVGMLTLQAKYPGNYDLKVIIDLCSSATVAILDKKVTVYAGTTKKEEYRIPGSTGSEISALHKAMANSEYLKVMYQEGVDGPLHTGAYTLSGGQDATLTLEDYTEAFRALEPYQYGYLSIDSDDLAIAKKMYEYVTDANTRGKLIVGVTGCMGEDYATVQAKIEMIKWNFNSPAMICLGNGYLDNEGQAVEGARAVAYTAGAISATPSNQSIVHSVIPGASDVAQLFTNEEYEAALTNGLLLLSVSADGLVWYDSGVNTLRDLSDLQDGGWKKIKRVKVRNELMERLDRCMAAKIGRVSCDQDGIADVLQSGIGVINDMVNERKLLAGATMYLDPAADPNVDSAWFVIDADDIDSMEKIYLHYQFRYSQSV